MADATQRLAAKALDRARSDTFFVASSLAEYMGAHNFDEADLAALLRCREVDLPRLAFCRAPTGERFVADLRCIAEFVRCDPDALAQLLREAEAVRALRHEARSVVPMAARDRLPPHKPKGDDDGT